MTGRSRLVVFLHGSGQSPQSWQEQVVAMPPGFTAIAPWLYGLRPGRADTFSLSAAADDVARSVDLQGAERAVVVGLSLGARVALEFAVRHPERVDCVVAASPPPQLPRLARWARELAIKIVPEATYRNQGLDKQKVVAATLAAREVERFDGAEAIRARVLLLAGAKDPASVAAAQQLAGRIDRSIQQVIDGAGHEMNVDAAPEFNRALYDFVGAPSAP